MADENGTALAVATKDVDAADLMARGVQQPADGTGIAPSNIDSFLLWSMAQAADGITPWGRLPKKRDRELREFWTSEPYLASATASVIARYAAFPWKLEGDEASVEVAHNMLKNSDYGRGWHHLVAKLCNDYLTQDSGAFVQFIRAARGNPLAPVVNLTHLDAWRCFPTGVPETPYIYLDRRGKYHLMQWYEIRNLMELPAPIEHATGGAFYELQYCAITRMLRAAQILRNIAIYKDEKTAGRFMRAIHLLGGVSRQEVQDAIAEHALAADQKGLLRYLQPLMVSALDPKAPVSVATLELASLPDSYDEEQTMRNYILVLALGFLTDYQEFAPLPGGNLGTSTQSRTLHQKAKGKGETIFKLVIEHLLNEQGALPQNVRFLWDESDVNEDNARETVRRLRILNRAQQIKSGEIDEEAALDMALAEGDVPEELEAGIRARQADRKAQAAALALAPPPPPPTGGAGPDVQTQTDSGNTSGETTVAQKAIMDDLIGRLCAGVKDDALRVELGAFLQTRIHKAFTTAADDLAGMGYMTTDERIALSGAIGDALELFASRMDDPALAPVSRALVDDDDIQTLIKALAAMPMKKKRTRGGAMPKQRMQAEQAASMMLEEELGAVFDKATGRIRAIVEGSGVKASRRRQRETQRVVRDKAGQIERVVTEREDA